MCDLLNVSVKIQSGRGGAERKESQLSTRGPDVASLPRPFASFLPLGPEYKAGKRAFTPNRPPPFRSRSGGVRRDWGGDGNGCGIPNLIP